MRIFLTVLISVFILSSCSSNKYRRSGNLSDAMEKASDEHEGDRKIKAVEYDEDETDEYTDQNSGEPRPGSEHIDEEYRDAHISFEDRPSFFMGNNTWMGFQYGSGVLSTESFYGLQSFALVGNIFWRNRKSLSWIAGFDYAPLQTTATAEFDPAEDEIAKALDGGTISFFAGGSYRYYTTPGYTFLGNYISAGVGIHSMFWKYKNTLEVDVYDEDGNFDHTDTVTHDQIWGLDINAAAGLNLMQFEHFRLGVEFNPGIVIWWLETNEGFTNDVFAPFLYLKTNFRFYLGG